MLSDVIDQNHINDLLKSLNPCSNGICSLTLCAKMAVTADDVVLILVLMEYAL